nr:hypothetical protein [Tanacetum cinerariifolium]
MSEKNKEGLGYTAVPPPTAQLYLSPKKDLSWTGLLECADDTVTDYSRPIPTLKKLRSPSRAPWVPSVYRNYPPVNRKLSTGSRNSPTANRKFPTASRKFPTGSIKGTTTDMGLKRKAVKPSAYWFWRPSQNLSNKGLKNNSLSMIFKKYTYIDTQGRLKSVIAWVPKEN